MADHITKQCIDAVAAFLASGSTDAGSNVFTGRVTPLAENELPALLVEGGDEAISEGTISTQLRRLSNVAIIGVVKHSDLYDAQAYSLLKQVEHLLAANPTLSGKCTYIVQTDIAWERNPDGDQPIVRAVLNCVAETYVLKTAVDAAL